MYFEDLTPFTDSSPAPSDLVLNVGWLGEGHQFPVAAPQPALVSALRTLLRKTVNLCRGVHQCEFCPWPPPENRNGVLWNTAPEEILGNGEIHVTGEDGITYVAPVLIRHYVEVHQYAPPNAFVRACLAHAEGFVPNKSLERTREG
jgi:hypothetical protein